MQTKVTRRKKSTAKTKPKEVQVKTAQVEKNTSKAIQQTVINRELKWLYPAGCTDTLARKAWRQKARNEIQRLERNIFKLQQGDNANEKATRLKIKELTAKAKEKRELYLANADADV
jgi:hypothetical protein